MCNIVKNFPGVRALNDVSFDLRKGEVHALLGENGAGKSTLMKVLLGMYRPDGGTIELKGREVQFDTPAKALKSGISMIHQELATLPEMTVWENVWIGRESTGPFMGVIDRTSMRERTRKLLEQFGMTLDVNKRVGDLSVAETQMLEIIRAVSYNADIIIMDEPTSAIEEKEVEPFFDTIRQLKAKGVAIIYISHKLDEISQIADRVTILRDASMIGTYDIGDITKDQMVSRMVGREITDMYPPKTHNVEETPVFEAHGISKPGMFENVNLTVRKGEIVGIAGLMGAGRSELVETLFGIRQKSGGEIKVDGKTVKIKSPGDAIKHGLAIVTEDRKVKGLVLCRSVLENISLAHLARYCFAQFILKGKEKKKADEMITALKIKTAGYGALANALSGGNQQKVVLGKWLSSPPKLLILDEPTRGIDVGAKYEIYKLMTKLASEGMGIIMISSELPEVISMSDRLIVMRDYKIKGELLQDELSQSELTQEAVMRIAFGE